MDDDSLSLEEAVEHLQRIVGLDRCAAKRMLLKALQEGKLTAFMDGSNRPAAAVDWSGDDGRAVEEARVWLDEQ